MFCSNCGKEISDQARFCNYCGSKVEIAQPQAAPVEPQQPVQPVQPAQAAQPSKPAKPKGKLGKRLLSIVLVVAVYYGAQYITKNVLTQKQKTQTQAPGSATVVQDDDPSLTASCLYGALYENGDLTYGMARVHMPGYKLMAGEGDERDRLISLDRTNLVYTSQQLEIGGISYDASDADGILKSFSRSGVDNSAMVDFRKYEVDGYPVIRYIASGTVDGMEEYFGELIIFPGRKPNKTLRIGMEALADGGLDVINRVFDTLKISRDFQLSSEDTNTMGLNRITVR